MSDNLFDRLFELFQSPGPVNWKLAGEVMQSIADDAEPIEPQLAEEYQELSLAAQLRIHDHTPLSGSGGEISPLDRRTWATENLESFRYVIDGLAANLDLFGGDGGPDNPFGAMLAPLGPALLGMQAGSMVGLLSKEVLGQWDTGLPPLDSDRPTVVVPNVERFAHDAGLDTRQVRLWAVLHEVVHHGVLASPPVKTTVVDRIKSFFDSVSFDPSALTGQLGALQDPARLQEMLGGDDPADLAGLLGVEHDVEKLEDVQALLGFLEGYGDHLVRTAGGALLPSLDRIEAAHAERRSRSSEATEALEQLTGLHLDRSVAGAAASFCREIERRWGPEALEPIWNDPEHFPRLRELDDPLGWAARVLLDDDLEALGLDDLDWDTGESTGNDGPDGE